MQRIEALARISEERGQLTRTFCSGAMRQANDCVGKWMRAAGMVVREDAIGNVIGRYGAGSPKSKVQSPKSAGNAPAKVLLFGSHLDTVRNAGKFDGPLGVLLVVSCVEELNHQKIRFPFGIEVIGFADEEGVRYQTAYLGSRAVAGKLSRKDLIRRDAAGISMAEAIRKFGGQPEALEQARLESRGLLGYVEAHIEQGPVLDEKKLSVGVVSAIAGQSRFKITFTGQAGHAGTTPMKMRRDALCAAAEFVLAVEKHARKTRGLVATVGQIQAEPNASNVIPGAVSLTLDVRHQDDSVRRSASAKFRKLAGQIAATRGLKVVNELVQETGAVPCCPALSGLLKRAGKMHQAQVPELPSGAGHDAAVLAKITPVAMLFVRCNKGISHNPAESVRIQDVRVALAVLRDFLQLLAGNVLSA
jgi:allantoate deiminase